MPSDTGSQISRSHHRQDASLHRFRKEPDMSRFRYLHSEVDISLSKGRFSAVSDPASANEFLTHPHSVDGTAADSQIWFPASVDMTEGSCAYTKRRPGLSRDVGNGSREWLPSPAMSCHQTDLSCGLSRTA